MIIWKADKHTLFSPAIQNMYYSDLYSGLKHIE